MIEDVMKVAVFFLLIAFFLITATCCLAGPDDILGVWTTEDNDAKVKIDKCGSKYCAYIVWLEQPVYPTDAKNGIPGTPVLDHNNPNPDMKKRPLLGLQIFSDFEFTDNNVWNGGTIYNSDNGKNYKGKIRLVSPRKLELRGFIGLSFLGRTTVWSRQNVL